MNTVELQLKLDRCWTNDDTDPRSRRKCNFDYRINVLTVMVYTTVTFKD